MLTRSLAASAVLMLAAWTLGALGVAGPAAAAPPTCADIDATAVGQTCQIQLSDPGYRVDITVPATYPDAEALFDYVTQTRDGFLNVARTPDARWAPYVLEMKSTEYRSAVPPPGTQSVVLETYENVGGPHAATFYKTFTWDQEHREAVTIDTLFREGTDPFPVLRALVQDEVTQQFGVTEPILGGAGTNPRTYQNFALTDDSVIFFFDSGTLLAETAGAFQVSVPREPLDALLA
ncbi:immunogenic protein MPT64 [Mycolicibacterium chitae]|uniref:Immunogenic protein MPT64 n=1 Tax=Mycolicibacterium chitae TaxID=1792 RepID=A0A448I8T0_MYCCI|nr:esterase [Mycolicibacterium chitae]BBZ05200.1 immunogenic protein MPT64 [Mycolicibacterium chitae]VEG48819.1 immunogenic protein MPT64 [Mycolicibacterium chitae]